MAQHDDHHDDVNGHHGHHDHVYLDEREWSDEEIERMILTGLVVLVAAVLSYLFGVYLPGRRKRAAASAAASAAPPTTPRQARQQRRTREEGGGSGGVGGGGGGVLPSSTPPVRLVDGVMPFSYLRAHREQLDEHRRKQQKQLDGGDRASAAEEAGSSSGFVPVDPREARRLLQRLSRLSRRSSPPPPSSSSASGAAASSSSSTSPPPSAVSMSAKRGALAVVTVRRRELESDELRCAARDVLHLLGSVCNLFVILSLDDDDDGEGGSDSKSSAQEVEREVERFKDRLYGASSGLDGDTGTGTAASPGPGLLHEAYVPRHRLVACSSPVGRIAFVRQLRPEWTLDYDPAVRDQLGRFGFHVILYGGDASSSSDDADGDGEGMCRTLGDLISRTAAAGSSSDAKPTSGHEKQE